MTSSAQLRTWWSDYKCDTSKYERVAFPGPNRTWNLYIAAEAVPVYEAFVRVMEAHSYYFREGAGGTYNCRTIAGSTKYSLHAYAIAIDLNPRANPYGKPLRYDYPEEFITDAENITANGKQALAWGGRWNTPDSMHWQINVSPADINEGVDDGMGLSEADLDAIRLIVQEELGGGRILMPKVTPTESDRYGNQGVVNSVWHATSGGRKLFNVLTEVPDDTVDGIKDVWST